MSEDFIYANLDFEYELANPGRQERHSSVARIQNEWSDILRILPGLESASELDPDQPPVHLRSLTVWGVTPSVQNLLEQFDLADQYPDWELVHRVNDKRFSHSLEKELGVALEGSGLVASMEALEAWVAQSSYDWVLKHPFGVSGREKMLGRQSRLSDSARGWVRRQFDKGWSLLAEPWVQDRVDFSVHYDLARDGSITYLGLCELISDGAGVYRGTRVPGMPRPEVLNTTDLVVSRLGELGYWGPVGIDGLAGRLGDTTILRPLVEINARYSFGRLALELARRLSPGWCLSWLHPKMPPALNLSPLPEAPAEGLYQLPVELRSSGRSRTLVAVAADREGLNSLEDRGI